MRALFPVFVLALAGCNATMPQQPRPTAADDPSGPCFGSLPSNPQFAAIAGKIPLADPRKASLDQLSDGAKASDVERQALSQWAKSRAECTERGRSFRAAYAPPGWSNAMENGQVSLTQAIAALYGGTLTYGQFNVERQKLAAQTQANLDASSRNAQQAESNQRASEQASALQGLQTMQLLQSMQPRPAPMPMPAPTVFCNSQRIGNQVNTTCR